MDNYPPEVQERFMAYYVRVNRDLTWDMILPKFFSKKSLRRNSDGFRMICPFHREKTASMQFSMARQSFYCFGCGSGGNIFKFIAHMIGGDMTDVMRFIQKNFHIPLPFKKSEWRKIKRAKNEAENEWYDWQSRLYYATHKWPFYETVNGFGLEDEFIGQSLQVEDVVNKVPSKPVDLEVIPLRLKKLFIIRRSL